MNPNKEETYFDWNENCTNRKDNKTHVTYIKKRVSEKDKIENNSISFTLTSQR
jgi:hypothetical protein